MSASSEGQRPVPVAALIDWTTRVLEAARVPKADAVTTAQVLVRSDLRGFGTHGLARLTSYMERLRNAEFNARPQINVERKGPVLNVHADGALGQVAAQRAVDEATAILPNEPMLWVSLRETGHLGALGIFTLVAAERGYVCFMGQRTPPLLGLPGFHRAALGHNPLAFAAPMGEGRPPFVFDMACSVAARGYILLAAREGKPIPENWALTSDGRSTTDAAEAVVGMLQPTGGYKGMGIAMMIECLAAALSATSESNREPTMVTPKGGAVPRQSAFFLFLNPALVDDRSAFIDYMGHMFDFYRESGGEQARVPGERGDALEQEGRARGLVFPASIDKELRALGSAAGIPFPGAGESG